MSEVRDTLVKARALIEKPEKWRGCGNRDGFCVAVAFIEATGKYDVSGAQEAFAEAIGTGPLGGLYRWNDDEARTHADVLAAFDRAIEAQS